MFPPVRRPLATIALLVGGLAVAVLAADLPVVTEENAFTFYRGFTRLTTTPRAVSPSIARLCVSPGPSLTAAEERRAGPHAQAWVHLYVNPAAEEAVRHRQTTFPPGSVVIKEKVDGDGVSPRAVGGMIKHAPGYDPAGGDWEYFYCEKDGAPTSGRLANCAACHAGAGATDHVFSVWNPDG